MGHNAITLASVLGLCGSVFAACQGVDGESDTGGDDGAAGALDPARLDRSAEGGLCGYPGPGPKGYGVELGQRLANFGQDGATQIIDCDGNPLEFADLLCERSEYLEKYPSADPSNYQFHNRAILITIGAGWCEPCIEETAELMQGVYEPLYGEGLEIVQVMFQDDGAQPPPKSFCRNWRDERFDEPLKFFVTLDQTFGWVDEYLLDPQTSTPVTMLVDANANIRFKVVGEKPKNTAAEATVVMADPYGY